MSSELSGLVSGLSGRVSFIETTYSYINQQLLQRPDLTDFSMFQMVWNSQFSQLSDSVSSLQSQMSSVQNTLVNLAISVSNNFSFFTGHTGEFFDLTGFLSGTNSGIGHPHRLGRYP